MRSHYITVVVLATGCAASPDIPTIELTPSDPTTVDALVLTIIPPLSIDQQTPEYSLAWSVDGTPVADVTGHQIAAERTTKHEVWQVRATLVGDGDPQVTTTDEVTIRNSPPVATVTLEPADPGAENDITASIETFDADMDDVGLVTGWSRDGVLSSFLGETLSANATRSGDRWEFIVTPNDGEEDGQTVSAEVQIR